MEKYRLIQESKVDEPPPTSPTQPQAHQQNTPPGQPYPSGKVSAMERSEYPEVRITQQGKPRNYISYAMNLLVRSCRLIFCCQQSIIYQYDG